MPTIYKFTRDFTLVKPGSYQVNQKMILMLTAAIMYRSLQQSRDENGSFSSSIAANPKHRQKPRFLAMTIILSVPRYRTFRSMMQDLILRVRRPSKTRTLVCNNCFSSLQEESMEKREKGKILQKGFGLFNCLLNNSSTVLCSNRIAGRFIRL